jgi:carboxypeptidase PM20D1
MLKKFFITILLLIVVFAAVILFNTFRYGKKLTQYTAAASTELPDSAISHLRQSIRIKTISWGNNKPADTAEFLAFREFLQNSYPLVHSKLELQTFGGFTYLFKWAGKDSTAQPFVLMGHYDVVPVEEAALAKWTVQPFSGDLKDNIVWGRGAVDDKGSVIAILEATEKLLSENFIPERNVFISLGHNEEIGGIGGAEDVAKWFKQNNIKPALVLDEGGMITKKLKYTQKPVALLSTAEKGYISFELKVEIPGGHSSQPARETAIDVMNKALFKLRKEQMPAVFSEPVTEMFRRLGSELPFKEKMAFANQWAFKNLIASSVENDGQQNAIFRTTLVPTIINAGIKDNVIPSVATAVVNGRILPGQSIEEVEAFMKKQIADDRVVIKRMNGEYYKAPGITPSDSKAFQFVESVTGKTIKDIVPVPFQLMGTTDSRYFQDYSDGVIRFIPYTDVKGYHGIDEQINLDDFRQMVFFYAVFLKEIKK